VREYQSVEIQKDYFKMFVKGFLLNFINIGVLMGWLGFIVIGSSLTSSKNGVLVFIATMVVTYTLVDLFKIVVAKTLKSKLTPKRIFKTKKIVALVILGFGVLLLLQGMFPKTFEKNKERIEQMNPLEK
ncbi:MAG: LysE family transporter, partial [Flavobacteriaceae bacterium]|nr:LysE family transporter [Flavobacteriaceae bacterium]